MLRPDHLLQGLLSQTIIYPVAARHEGRDIASREAWLRRTMALDHAERRALSRKALADIVAWAGHAVPYYRDLFAKLSFDPSKLEKDAAWLNDLPYLTKDIIRTEGDRMLREDRANLRDYPCKTGGSTGLSMVVHYDQDAADWSSAVTHFARASIGKRHYMRELHFASRFPEVFPLRDRIREHIKCLAMNRYNIFFDDLSADSLETIWRKLRRIRPTLIHGHPSTIYQLALHIADTRGCAQAFDLFESSGELLEGYQREKIETALRCRVIDRYGLAEFGVVAYQSTPDSHWLDVYDPIAWPEVAQTDASVTDALPHDRGTTGELVLTGLKNRMMPLIRYRTGDVASLGEEPRGFVLYNMLGRIHDIVHINGKAYPTHYIQDVLDRLGGIREFQISTSAPRPLLRLVLEPGADRNAVAAKITHWWHDGMDVAFIEHSDLTLQGGRSKFRHVVTS